MNSLPTFQTTAVESTAPMAATRPKITGRNVNVFYGEKHAIKDVNVDIPERSVMAFIGPSGCGKSTFLRCINRMNDTISICRVTGNINIDEQDIYDRDLDVVQLRARVGMVFQKPNPFPKSIYENVAYGPRIHGLVKSKTDLDEVVETSLKKASLWNEVKDRLQESGTGLSGPAAAPLHRPRHRRLARGDPDGRALLGARPHRHRQDRGADRRAEAELHHRHRHPLDAAGRPRVAAQPPSSTSAFSSRRARRTRSSPIRPTRAPATTSPAASADFGRIAAAVEPRGGPIPRPHAVP